jgi:hypothetical protein
VKRVVLFAVLTALFSAMCMATSFAQTKPRHRTPAAKPAEGVDASTPMAGRGETASSSSSKGSADSGAVEAKTVDGGTRVFRFGEMEIEGRLRTPQLVYFLRRVRAEFAAGDLGHRTFMRELSETRKDPNF